MKSKIEVFLWSSLIFVQPATHSATLPSGFTETLTASGISSPTAMEFSPDGRLFVCQQTGELRVIKNGSLLSTPFLSITTDASGERGLLGIAFDPAFASNQRVYIYYTVKGTIAHNRISAFTANGDVAAAGSEMVLLDLDNLSSANNHNGGAIHFGLDGKLYAGVGDNANSSNSQSLATVLGKVLRLNPDGSIPTDNPFYGTASGNNRAIWALGLRNPFTVSIQPGTGRILINDVGESTWEEIDDGVGGSNYGWPYCEGACNPANPSYRDPIYQYSHSNGCAIVGGTFYNPANTQFPAQYVGTYFFSDLCGGWIRVLDPANQNAVSTFATGLSNPVDLKVGPDGALYYLERGLGSVYRASYTGSSNGGGPSVVTLTLQSSPSGFSLTLDGQTITTPYSFQSTVGMTRTIGAPSSERLNKTSYRFVSWSDGGAQTHQIITPDTDTTYTASYTSKKGHP